MADEDLSYAHAAAILVLAEAGTPYSGYVGEVNAEELTYPYFCVWVPPGIRDTATLATVQSIEFRQTVQITIAGRDPQETAAAADRITEALVDHKPEVAGRRNSRLKQVPISVPIAAAPGDHDPSTGRQVYLAYLQVLVFSLPEPA